MAIMSEEVAQELLRQPWDDIGKRLLLYTARKMRGKTWMGVRGGDPTGAYEAQDYVDKVIEKLLTGERNWDPKKDSNLFQWLTAQIDSEISNALTSLRNKRAAPASWAAEQPDNQTPESLYLEKEQQKEAEEILLGFYEFLEDEPDLQEVVGACILEGITKRSEVIEHCGIKSSEYDSRRKRLARRFEAYKAGRH